ncbi:MAG TPA: hypothetical protein VMU26_30635 [Candidatus Polarisedimenticolia bacterium]|nr:hypothetical protein [Candidatus Polarisedimenticolia bacterium]
MANTTRTPLNRHEIQPPDGMALLTKIALVLMTVLFLSTMLAGQQKPFPVTSVVDAPTIAGHPVQLDERGKLLPWPMPYDIGYSYSSHFLTQWTILWDQHNRQRLHYYYCCFDFDRTTFELAPDPHWANSTGYLRAMMQGFIERLYPYNGDPRTIIFLQRLVDYELENGLTPEDYLWSQVPYASADPGAKRYNGWSQLGNDYIEPHVVGEDGYGYLRLYEMTGNTKYLRAAVHCADALVKNYKPGDQDHSPWPVRLSARDGKTVGTAMGPYSANVIEPIMLFDELIRLGQGDVTGYTRVRAAAWDWFQKYPLSNNFWVGYFEDVTPSMDNMNQVIPLEFVRYVLLHPEKDPQWREHARQLIEWVTTTHKWPKYIVHGATVTTEQGNGINFCCNEPNQCCDSHTSRLAAVEAFYFAKTGDVSYRDAAFRSYNWVTYFQGLSRDAHSPFSTQWWFTDEYADGPRRMMDAFWAVPEWAPADESHLLGSSSVITKISYGKGSVTYSTFDPQSSDVLRLDFVPEFITANGKPLGRRKNLDHPGFTFDDSNRVLRIRHDDARDIDVQGKGGNTPPYYVSFDDPHLPADTVLKGQYPTGVIDWGAGTWRIDVPEGAFGSFNLSLVDSKASGAQFRFCWPRLFVGLDVYNGGISDATVTIRSAASRAVSVTVKPGQLRRLRTGWRDVSSSVMLELKNGEGLRFDNLAYIQE